VHDFNHDNFKDLMYIGYNHGEKTYYFQGINFNLNKLLFNIKLKKNDVIDFGIVEDLNGDESEDAIILYRDKKYLYLQFIDILHHKELYKPFQIYPLAGIPSVESEKFKLRIKKLPVNNDSLSVFFTINVDDFLTMYGIIWPELNQTKIFTETSDIIDIISHPESESILLYTKNTFFSKDRMAYSTRLVIYHYNKDKHQIFLSDSLVFPFKADIQIFQPKASTLNLQYVFVLPESSGENGLILKINRASIVQRLTLPKGKILAYSKIYESSAPFVRMFISSVPSLLVQVNLDAFKITEIKKLDYIYNFVDDIKLLDRFLWYSIKNVISVVQIKNQSDQKIVFKLDPLSFYGKFDLIPFGKNTYILFPDSVWKGYYFIYIQYYGWQNYFLFFSILILITILLFIFTRFIPYLFIAFKVLQFFVSKSEKGILVLNRDGYLLFFNELISDYLKKDLLQPLKRNKSILSFLDRESILYHHIRNMIIHKKGFLKNMKIELNQKTAEVLIFGEPLIFLNEFILGYLVEAVNVSTMIDTEREDIWTRSFKKTISMIETPITNIMINNTAMAIHLNEKKRMNREMLMKHIERIDQSLSTIKDIRNKLEKVIEIKGINRKLIMVEELIKQSLRKFSSHFDSDIDLILNYESTLPPIQIDADLLQLALENIIENSIDAMNGKGMLHISCSLIQYPLRNFINALEITISDTGKGLNKEFVPFVFEPYFSTKPFGTGLGLAITKKIVQAHGGEIFFNSTVDVGSSVTIIIPYLQ
jgi:signal transduction histidine kinase